MQTKQVMQQFERDPTLPPAVERNKNTVLRFTVNLVMSKRPRPIVAWLGPVWFISASFEDTALGLVQKRPRFADGKTEATKFRSARLHWFIYTYLQSATATKVTKDCVGWGVWK